MRIFHSCLRLIILLALSGQPLKAQSSPPTLQVLDSDPRGGGILPLNRTLYVKVRYDSAEPVRVRAEGFFQAKPVKDITNPSPIYPPGSGETVAWISYRAPTQIDEVHVTLTDENWRPLTSVSVPMSASWEAGVPDPAVAPWVRELSDAQQSMVLHSMQQSSGDASLLDMLLPAILMLSVPGYLILQIVSLISNGWKSLSAAPLIVMVPLAAYTAYAFAMQSNLWPLLFIFASPVAFLYLVVIRVCKLG